MDAQQDPADDVSGPLVGSDGTGPGDSPDHVATPDPWTHVEAAVSMDGVGHSFRGRPALEDLSITVPTGRITVLLGPNGAGKTTAIRAMTGALEPDEGTVRTLGMDPVAQGTDLRRRCGVVSAKPALYDRLSGRDNLRFAAEIYGLGRHADDRIESVAQRFGIGDALDRLVGGYSTGMKTRLALARSVVHEPELALFDEPTSGLDPESANAVLALIEDMTYEGSTVVMCTHLLSEAEGLADHIVMMEAGGAVVSGSPEDLIRNYWPDPIVEIEAEDPRILDRIAGWEGVRSYSRVDHVASVGLVAETIVPDMIISLVRDGARLRRIDPQQRSLEDLYFAIRRNGADRTDTAVGSTAGTPAPSNPPGVLVAGSAPPGAPVARERGRSRRRIRGHLSGLGGR